MGLRRALRRNSFGRNGSAEADEVRTLKHDGEKEPETRATGSLGNACGLACGRTHFPNPRSLRPYRFETDQVCQHPADQI
jgi:hypothetical protein